MRVTNDLSRRRSGVTSLETTIETLTVLVITAVHSEPLGRSSESTASPVSFDLEVKCHLIACISQSPGTFLIYVLS